MRFTLNNLEDSPYDRPHQPWRCGLSHEGEPCPAGPTDRGACPGASACRPVRDGDRWLCNRSPLRGGPCSEGPGPQGECAIAYRCTPFRSLRSRRGQLVSAAAVAALGALLILLAADWRREAIAPGPLSVHHAQLLTGARAAERCAACHAAGGGLIVPASAAAGIAGAAAAPTQTALCMACHDKRLAPQHATAAHTLDPVSLPRAVGGAPRRDPDEPIACSACHREHQGRDHDLRAIAGAACQACHAVRYDSFAGAHPEFADWPYRRRTRIAFDHGSHHAKHYPEQRREFACAACHQLDSAGGRMTTHGYDAACRECHDAGIATSLAPGIAVFALPTLDVDALAEAGYEIGDWPDDPQGDFDGPLSPAAKLLVAADPHGAAGLAVLGPRFDFYDLDPEDDKQLAAAAQVVGAYKRALGQMAAGGTVEALVPGLAPAAARAWLARLLPDAVAPDSVPAAATSATDLPAARALGPLGAWEFDDAALVIRYRASGHADAALVAWFEALAAAASDDRAALADPLLRDLVKPTAPGQCGSCHSLERDPAGRLSVQWRADPGQPHGAASLTRFSHAPHMTQPELRDCQACHQLAAGVATTSYAHDDPTAFIPGFAPLAKADCAACHRPQAAGSSCTQCHRYHGSASRSP